MGFGDGVLEHGLPLGVEEFDRAVGRALIDVENECAADADAFHGFEVGGDSFAGEVAGEPGPIDPGAGRVGRLREGFLNRVEARCVRGTREVHSPPHREREG